METFLSIVLLLFFGVYFYIRVVQRTVIFEYQRGLKYKKGKFIKILEPGSYYVPINTKINQVDIRKKYEIIPGQEVLTADGASVKLTLVAAYGFSDLDIAINKVENFRQALYTVLQTILREAVGKIEIDVFIKEKSNLSKELTEAAKVKVKEIGLELTEAVIRDIMIVGELKKALSKVATAKQEGLAKLERARGEMAAIRNLANVSKIIEDNPNLLQLRILDVLSQSTGHTIVFSSDLNSQNQMMRKFNHPKKNN